MEHPHVLAPNCENEDVCNCKEDAMFKAWFGAACDSVVTGGNKGPGYHIADSLVRSGLFGAVVIGCRDEGRGQKAANELGCDFLQLELGNAASTASFASKLEEKYGRLDTLVNNAAIAFKGADPTPFEQQTAPTLDINYRGTRAVTDADSFGVLAGVRRRAQ